MVKALNRAYDDQLSGNCMMIGEDINDPYGGAFKVTKGLQEKYPDKILSTPISEIAITGLGIGLSMSGTRTFVEIMFGDFITNATDQIINNACKFYHMYGLQSSAPVIIRAPMGGRRGYGPTHSQSLEKMFLGMDNLAVFAPSSMIDPKPLINYVAQLECPSLIVENKVDYGAFLWKGADGLEFSIIGGNAGSIKVSPIGATPEVTLISYGMMGRLIADSYLEIFSKSDVVFELWVLQQLHPIPLQHFSLSAAKTKSVIVIEDGSPEFGWGSEVIFNLSKDISSLKAQRLGALPVSIPSVRTLEDMVLPSISDVIEALKKGIEE
jgi:pyruvate/2-oxoglutarate/acetoin dehydrogenase E1 component